MRWGECEEGKRFVCCSIYYYIVIFSSGHIFRYYLCHLRKLRLCPEEEVSLLLLSLADLR